MDYVPTDEILDALAPEIGIKKLYHLGIELGLNVTWVENIEDNCHAVERLSQVLYKWRDGTTGKATLGVLEQALENIGKGTMCLETVVRDKGVKKRHISRKHDV